MTLDEFLLRRYAEQHRGCDDLSEWAERALAAMRRIVEIHRPSGDTAPEFLPYCEGCWEEGGMDGAPTYPCRTARALAMPYADHPDYDEEWRP